MTPLGDEPEVLPNLLDILRGYEWHDRAACRDAEELDLFFPDRGSGDKLGEPSNLATARLRSCWRRCYLFDLPGDAAVPRRVATIGELRRDEEDERRAWATPTASAIGVWGGSFTEDRWALRHLPPREAADSLEVSFPERLQTRFAAWTAFVWRRPPTSAGRTKRTRWDKLVIDQLAAGAWRLFYDARDESDTTPLPVTATTRRPARCLRCDALFSWRTAL